MGSALATGQLHRYLAALYAHAPEGSYVEMRSRTALGMRQAFHDVNELDAVAYDIRRHAAHTDVYVGVMPRHRRGGGRADVVPAGDVLWADCDTPKSVAKLAAFSPAASMVVASGTEDHRHAYFLLDAPVPVDTVETANRSLALLLGADAACADRARILRPPSLSHKHDPARPVQLLTCDDRRRYALADVVGDLVDPACDEARSRACVGDDELLLLDPALYVQILTGLTVRRDRKINCPLHDLSVTRCPGSQKLNSAISCGRDVKGTPRSSDPLRLIPPPVYFERLTGLRVGRSGKLRCLFHDDRSPSLHVYREPDRGWYCFGCGRGGSIYDLGALLWLTGRSAGRDLRGDDFRQIRDELQARFCADPEQPQRPHR